MKFDFINYKPIDLNDTEREGFNRLYEIGKCRFYNGGIKLIKFVRSQGNSKNYLSLGKAPPIEHFKQIIKSEFIVEGLDILEIKTTPQLIEEQNVNPSEQIKQYPGLSRFIGELGTVLSIGGAYSMLKLSENQSHKKFLLKALQFVESFW
jgi:hypothetical protein